MSTQLPTNPTNNRKKTLNLSNICTIDLEATTYNELTGENKDKIDLVGFYGNGEYHNFKTIDELCNFIFDNMKDYNNYTCFAHNGGGYDFLYLIRGLRKYSNNTSCEVAINGKWASIIFAKEEGKFKYQMTFRDSYKLMPTSLKNLGKGFGFPKTEMPSWTSNQKKGLTFDEHYQQAIVYNKNDCLILYNIIREFLSDPTFSFLKSIPLTCPALSFKTFKNMVGIKRLNELSTACYYDDFIRRSYSGGRTEMFKHKINSEYSYLDVNSLFPSEMLKPLPVGKAKLYKSQFDAKKCLHDESAGIYKIKWKSPNLHTPILWEKKGKLLFCNHIKEEGEGYYALPEIQNALEHGYEVSPLQACICPEEETIFKDFVLYFMKMKVQGGAKKVIAKLMMNSLYGKTAQRLSMLTSSKLDPEEIAERTKIYEENLLCYKKALDERDGDKIAKYFHEVKSSRIELIDEKLNVYNYVSRKEPHDTNVMWASYITSRARTTLWNAFNNSNFEQAYCDTDSVFIPTKYLNKFQIHDSDLGKWKEEGKVHDAIFYAPKSYILDITENKQRKTKIVMKGVDNEIIRPYYNEEGFVPHDMYDEIVEKFKPNVEFVTTKVTQYKQALRMGLETGSAREMTKRLSLSYDKRIILNDYQTAPICF